MPDDVEGELYQHIVWMCENRYPINWDSIKAMAWHLGKICRMQGERRIVHEWPVYLWLFSCRYRAMCPQVC